MGKKLDTNRREAARALCIFVFIATDTLGHRLRDLQQGRYNSLRSGLSKDELEYVGKLADRIFAVAGATRKLSQALGRDPK